MPSSQSSPEQVQENGEDTSSSSEPHSAPSTEGWAQAVVVGAVSSGVNKPTWALVNVFLLLVIIVAAFVVVPVVLLLQSQTRKQGHGARDEGRPSFFADLDIALLGHVLVLVLLALGLLVLLNWLITETGTVPVSEQVREMGLEDRGEKAKKSD